MNSLSYLVICLENQVGWIGAVSAVDDREYVGVRVINTLQCVRPWAYLTPSRPCVLLVGVCQHNVLLIRGFCAWLSLQIVERRQMLTNMDK